MQDFLFKLSLWYRLQVLCVCVCLIRYQWVVESLLLGESNALIRWDIPQEQADGTYRIRHFGSSKAAITQTVTPFEGQTKDFVVKSPGKTVNVFVQP